jgi:hypothetical protein
MRRRRERREGKTAKNIHVRTGLPLRMYTYVYVYVSSRRRNVNVMINGYVLDPSIYYIAR